MVREKIRSVWQEISMQVIFGFINLKNLNHEQD